MQIKQALAATEKLKGVSETPEVDLEFILCHVLDKPRSYLFTWPERELTDVQQERFSALLEQRSTGMPVAHLTGTRGFWSFELEVSPDTLIPRPDTELLVETALRLVPESRARVADLGTGTGAIALALAIEKPGWQLVASDFQAGAVALAERNRKKLDVTNLKVIEGSWFAPHQGRYQMIVSNPPYIDPQDKHLQQGDVRFEPLTALTAAKEGMADIELISQQARSYLDNNGWLAFEHGYDQGERCRKLLHSLGYKQVETFRDYAGNDRVTCGQWPGTVGV